MTGQAIGFCPKCGTARPPGAAFCPTCGTRFEDSPQQLAPNPTGWQAPAARPGVGFARGRFPLLLVALVVLVGGCVAIISLGALLGASPGVAPGDVSTRGPVSVQGSGVEESRPFQLAGDYLVIWSAKAGSGGCYHVAFLERTDGGPMIDEMFVKETVWGGAPPLTGTTRLYDLDAASYYVDVTSGCRWTFTFAPN